MWKKKLTWFSCLSRENYTYIYLYMIIIQTPVHSNAFLFLFFIILPHFSVLFFLCITCACMLLLSHDCLIVLALSVIIRPLHSLWLVVDLDIKHQTYMLKKDCKKRRKKVTSFKNTIKIKTILLECGYMCLCLGICGRIFIGLVHSDVPVGHTPSMYVRIFSTILLKNITIILRI